MEGFKVLRKNKEFGNPGENVNRNIKNIMLYFNFSIWDVTNLP